MTVSRAENRSVLRSWLSIISRLILLVIGLLIMVFAYRAWNAGVYSIFQAEFLRIVLINSCASLVAIIPVSLLMLLFERVGGRKS